MASARLSFFTTLVGESNQHLTYLLAWNPAERETKWTAFVPHRPGLAQGAR